MGAPKIAVTVLIFSYVGAKAVLAIKSQNMQNTPPPKNVAGITTNGLAVFSSRFTKKGTAMPTKEIGPANAVTVADKILESKIRQVRNTLIFTPILLAYASPS